MKRRLLLGMVVALAAAVATGCGDDGPERGAAADPSQLPPVAVEPIPDDASASDDERAAFTDGRIEFAEYEAAVRRTIACLRAAGLVVEGGTSSSGRSLSYSYEVVTPSGVPIEPAQARADAAYARCYSEHEARIGEAWLAGV